MYVIYFLPVMYLEQVRHRMILKFISRNISYVVGQNSPWPTDCLVFMLSGQITFLRAPPLLSNAGSISFCSVYVIICKSQQNWTMRHKGELIHSLMKYLQIIPTVKYFCPMTQCRVLKLNNLHLLPSPCLNVLGQSDFISGEN